MFAVEYRNTMRTACKPKVEPLSRRRTLFIERISPETRESRRRAKKLHVPEWVATIIYAVAAQHVQSVHDIMSKTRVPAVVRARDEIAYRLRAKGHDHREITLNRIGRWLGREATTTSFAIGRHAEISGLPPLTDLNIEARRTQISKCHEMKRRAA